MEELTNADLISAWSNAPTELIESFGTEGDVTRKYLLNPVIFALLGDVKGKVILDAGVVRGISLDSSPEGVHLSQELSLQLPGTPTL